MVRPEMFYFKVLDGSPARAQFAPRFYVDAIQALPRVYLDSLMGVFLPLPAREFGWGRFEFFNTETEALGGVLSRAGFEEFEGLFDAAF